MDLQTPGTLLGFIDLTVSAKETRRFHYLGSEREAEMAETRDPNLVGRSVTEDAVCAPFEEVVRKRKRWALEVQKGGDAEWRWFIDAQMVHMMDALSLLQ